MSVLSEAVRLIIISGAAFLAALAVTPLWLKLLRASAWRKHIRDRTEAPVYNAYHEKKMGTLTSGGVIIWGTTLLLTFLFGIMNFFFDGFFEYFDFLNRRETYLPLAALGIGGILGLVDDWFGVKGIGGANGGGLRVREKLIGYTAIAAVGAWWFYYKLEWTVLYVPFFGNVEIGSWYVPFFIFILIATLFSANETDGLDGLLGGVSLFALLALTTVAFALGRYDLAAFGGAIIGSLLAFLWFNIYPARFFMGDTGSISLGVTIGVIAMLTNTALLLPFFASILVLESVSVLVQLISKRTRGKKLLLSTPIHHHFEALGWPESQVTMRFWIISAVGCALGLAVFFLARVL